MSATAPSARQGTRARKDRFRLPRRDDDALLQRNPKTAETLLAEAYEIQRRREVTDPETFIAEFAARLLKRLQSAPPVLPTCPL